jgi:hypothetical protein
MRPIIFVFSTVLLLNLAAGAQSPASHATPPAPAAKLEIRPLPPELLQRASALHAQLQPSAKSWIEQQAKIEAKRPKPDLDELRSAIRQRFAASHPNNAAVEAVAALVLLQMAQDRDASFRTQMAQVYALTQQKQALQTLADQLNHEAALAKESKRAGVCQSSLCVSLPSRLAQLNAASANTPRPIHLQAPANLTYQQLAMVQANIARELNNLNENIQTASETVQNSRGLASNQVQSDNQNANTMWNQIASILKDMNDEIEAPIHNML